MDNIARRTFSYAHETSDALTASGIFAPSFLILAILVSTLYIPYICMASFYYNYYYESTVTHLPLHYFVVLYFIICALVVWRRIYLKMHSVAVEVRPDPLLKMFGSGLN